MNQDARRIYQLLVVAMWSDGHAHEREVEALGDITAAFPELARVQSPELAREAKQLLDARGLADAVAELAAPLQDRAARELAFTSCARLLEADRVIARQEFQVLARLRVLFELNAADVARLLGRAD